MVNHNQSNPHFSESNLKIPTINFTEGWFEYLTHAFPHHTDYAGVVWHGTYVSWLEELRVAGLRLAGLDYSLLVAAGCDLPVVEMRLRYHQSIRMGMDILVRGRMMKHFGVRIPWEYSIESVDRQERYASAEIVLVPVDRSTNKILRRLPENLKTVLEPFVNDLEEVRSWE
ncbi:MAG: acyl-CoA thioesterase [Microcoleaceae cyanobacterium]